MILMKIYLFLKNKIAKFFIPEIVAGSFSFDENKDESDKLINVEARNNEWVLYSTAGSSVLSNGKKIQAIELKPNNYYILERENQKYLIFVTSAFDDSFKAYTYKSSLNLSIGNGGGSNVSYACSLFRGNVAGVSLKDGQLVLAANNNVYLNNNYFTEKTCRIKTGDEINIYGLRIVFMEGFLLINNPMNAVIVGSKELEPYVFKEEEELEEVEFKDNELYEDKDYYSKAPRLRRLIKTKEIDISPPPHAEGEKELPLLLTIGPMLTMAIVSGAMFANNLSKLINGETTIEKSWPQLLSTGAMLVSMLVWPTVTRIINKRLKKKRKKELFVKYNKYLNKKEKELEEEEKLQKEIINENLLQVEQCVNIINNGRINFWDKRIDQADFLEVRLGRGNVPLDVQINWPKEGFSIDEDELREQAEFTVNQHKFINNVPVGYSLSENRVTAIMGDEHKIYGLIHNIILQLITFYSYDDIKLVVITKDKNERKWDYLKYLNHTFSNDKSIRFFSTNFENSKVICDYLNMELKKRLMMLENNNNVKTLRPHYIIITDDYSSIKRHDFLTSLTEQDDNLGFSLLILESQLSKLPSKCNNFISLGSTTSGILKNSFEEQEQITFYDEINDSIDMMKIAKKLSNIPIEFEEGLKNLPDSVSFLEMENVGKIEQLNILNRWRMNDSTNSLRAEIGLDEYGNLMFLDLHEKYHGPHGLIAGMTGSGKSEFIITYILSMAINYSPDDIAFILIDYKGGGLAFAFENKTTGVSLPHLAGTITNLDKAEMDRTLVSIDSEMQRRQQIFNKARDLLGESTMDIYKYQRYYKEGRLTEPIPHLFIICDEFAELKVNQPEFMDSLISTARIGRSLGVHLILATQKPSGVVNEQIWSNTKFRVCLKVQDASDSKEMLKRPEAAYIKQTGRFYLQVGFDEYFALGQSAWCGAKYYPSDQIVKQVDRSINFINDNGGFIKSIQAGNGIKIEPKGEQLANIMESIIEVSKMTNKRVKRLWLNDIDPIILVDNLEKKYGFTPKPHDVVAVIGEYDAPEKQEQGLLTYSLSSNGNTAIFGNDEREREKLVNSIVYSICKNHTAKEAQIYAIDYGSESLRTFSKFPQVGGLVFMGEDERFRSLFKLINEELKNRKKLLLDYNGAIELYNMKNEEKLPQIIFIINNYEAVLEAYSNIYEDISSLGRDCERYGIYLIMTSDGPGAMGRRVGQCFENKYALHLSDSSDYYTVFNLKSKIKPRDVLGRGLANNDGVHEFQTASIVEDEAKLVDFLDGMALKMSNDFQAPPIPSLPNKVTLDIMEKEISTINKVPVGISKETLKVIKHDFTATTSTTIASNRLKNINSFMDSLLDVLVRTKDINIFFIDTFSLLPSASQKVFGNNKVNYYNSNLEEVFDNLTEMQKNPVNKKFRILYIFYGVEKLKAKMPDAKIEALFAEIKNSENSNIIFADSGKSLKALDMDSWYSKNKNTSDGVWIGKGFTEQQNFRLIKITKEMSATYPNNYAFYINENTAELIKILEFNDMKSEEEEEDEE